MRRLRLRIRFADGHEEWIDADRVELACAVDGCGQPAVYISGAKGAVDARCERHLLTEVKP